MTDCSSEFDFCGDDRVPLRQSTTTSAATNSSAVPTTDTLLVTSSSIPLHSSAQAAAAAGSVVASSLQKDYPVYDPNQPLSGFSTSHGREPSSTFSLTPREDSFFEDNTPFTQYNPTPPPSARQQSNPTGPPSARAARESPRDRASAQNILRNDLAIHAHVDPMHRSPPVGPVPTAGRPPLVVGRATPNQSLTHRALLFAATTASVVSPPRNSPHATDDLSKNVAEDNDEDSGGHTERIVWGAGESLADSALKVVEKEPDMQQQQQITPPPSVRRGNTMNGSTSSSTVRFAETLPAAAEAAAVHEPSSAATAPVEGPTTHASDRAAASGSTVGRIDSSTASSSSRGDPFGPGCSTYRSIHSSALHTWRSQTTSALATERFPPPPTSATVNVNADDDDGDVDEPPMGPRGGRVEEEASSVVSSASSDSDYDPGDLHGDRFNFDRDSDDDDDTAEERGPVNRNVQQPPQRRSIVEDPHVGNRTWAPHQQDHHRSTTQLQSTQMRTITLRRTTIRTSTDRVGGGVTAVDHSPSNHVERGEEEVDGDKRDEARVPSQNEEFRNNEGGGSEDADTMEFHSSSGTDEEDDDDDDDEASEGGNRRAPGGRWVKR